MLYIIWFHQFALPFHCAISVANTEITVVAIVEIWGCAFFSFRYQLCKSNNTINLTKVPTWYYSKVVARCYGRDIMTTTKAKKCVAVDLDATPICSLVFTDRIEWIVSKSCHLVTLKAAILLERSHFDVKVTPNGTRRLPLLPPQYPARRTHAQPANTSDGLTFENVCWCILDPRDITPSAPDSSS